MRLLCSDQSSCAGHYRSKGQWFHFPPDGEAHIVHSKNFNHLALEFALKNKAELMAPMEVSIPCRVLQTINHRAGSCFPEMLMGYTGSSGWQKSKVLVHL